MICKDSRSAEVHRRFLVGDTIPVLAKDYGFTRQQLGKHLVATGLQKRYQQSTLVKVRLILRHVLKDIHSGKKEIGDALAAKCLELEAKLTGELDERTTTNIGVIISPQERSNRLAKGMAAFGVQVISIDTGQAVVVQGDGGTGYTPDSEQVESV